MNILVTGGAGFIGTNLCEYLIHKYPTHLITCIDNMSYASNRSAVEKFQKNPNYKFMAVDIRDAPFVNYIFKTYKFDYVLHLAAESHVDNSILNPSIFVDTNVFGTQVLLEAARKYCVRRFLYCSTDEVMGSLGEYDYFDEFSPIQPNSPYSATKAGGELLVRSYFKTYNLPTLITRCSNNYGPWQHKEKFIPKSIISLLTNQKIQIYGNGINIRDWLYVKDHCKALDLVLNNGTPGQIYCIGGKNELCNNQIVRRLIDLIKSNEPYIDWMEYISDRPGHDYRYAVDFSYIKQKLGWEPLMNFKDGLEKTIEWYKNAIQV